MSVYSYRHHRKIYYYFRVSIGGRQFNRRLNHGSRFHSKEEALLAESNFLLKYKRNNKDKILVDSLVPGYKNYLLTRYKSTTCRSYYSCFNNYFLSLMKYKKLSEINDDFIISVCGFIDDEERGNKDLMYKTLRSFVSYMATFGIHISWQIVVRKKESRDLSLKNPRFWSIDDFGKFYSVIDDDFWKLLFSVLYYYGLRIGELRGIKKINFTKNKLVIDSQVTNKSIYKGQRVTTPKTSSSYRNFPMFPFIYDLYLNIENEDYIKDSEYLFPSRYDSSLVIGESTINRKLNEYCRKAHVNKINLHGFRHSCASLLINKGMDAL